MCVRAAPRVVLAALQVAAYGFVHWYFGPGPSKWCILNSFVTDCHSSEGLAAVRDNRTHVRVIVQGAGQTGTTSVVAALRELGLRAFHADDYSVFAKRVMYDHGSFERTDWIRTVSRCRMEAVSLEPCMDTFPLFLATSPGAKVIVTWRSYASWVKSLHSNAVKEQRFGVVAAPLYRASYLLPFLQVWDRLTGQIEAARREARPQYGEGISVPVLLYRWACNGYSWPGNNIQNRGTRKIKAGEEAYLGMINEARVHTERGRLLEFDASRHGWGEFAAFMGVEPPPPGTPFPHPRSKRARTNEESLESNPVRGTFVLFLQCVMHVANYCAVAVALRALAGAAWSLLVRPGGPGPLAERLADALAACPVVAVLGDLEPEEALGAARALADAGVRVVEVPLDSRRPEECIAALSRGLPAGVIVGSCSVRTEGDVAAAAAAGAALASSPHADGSLIRLTKRRGMLSLPGVCTPSEAAAALRHGADALGVFPAERMRPEALAAWRQSLPPDVPLLVSWAGEHQALGEYSALGVSGFRLAGEALRVGGSATEVRARVRELVG